MIDLECFFSEHCTLLQFLRNFHRYYHALIDAVTQSKIKMRQYKNDALMMVNLNNKKDYNLIVSASFWYKIKNLYKIEYNYVKYQN